MKMKLFFLLMIAIFSLILPATGSIVYVDTDGSGDYNCDGTDDHIQINQALAFVGSNAGYHTVHLNGSNTYWINSTLNMYGDTIFEGDSDAEIKLIDEAGWGTYTPLISNTTAGSNNFTIRGFEIDGNSENQSVSRGVGYYNLMYFYNCYNVTVDNMRLEWSTGDGLKVSFTGAHVGNKAFVTFTNNFVYKLGHDALYAIRLNNVTAAHNDIQTRTNSGIRLTDSGNGTIYNNTIYSILVTGGSTGPGIQFDKNDGTIVENIEVYNNTIHTMVSSGMWITGFDNDDVIRTGNIHIHHNTFYNVGQRDTDPHGYQSAAITIGQFNDILIENNVIDDSGLAGIKSNIYYGEYHMDASFTNTIRNNIITNNEVGIWNDDDNTHTFISENNCFYNNIGGVYNGTNITYLDDIYVEPLFVDTSSYDYHLKSKAGTWNSITSSWDTYSVHSPCIDAGNESSDYSNEPYPNGGRINIGVYGNTIFASKSDTILSVDNIIKSNAPNNIFSNTPNLDVGQREIVDKFRSWIWFDLSEYASTETIDNAILNMTWYYNTAARNQSTNVSIYFPNKTVDTNYLSWNNSSNEVSWVNLGGDWLDANNVPMGNTPFDSVIFPNTSPDMAQHSWNLTTLVQSIVNGSKTNNGFFIIANETNSNYIAFSSLDNETEADRPTLTITTSNYTRIEFITPTLTNNSVTNDNYVEINVSIELESITLDSFTWNWNSTNTTFLNSSCILHMSFDNNSAIGENSTIVVDVSQYGNNGSFENSITGTWTTDGHNRGAMSFVPGDSVVISPSQNIDDDQLTVTAWINPSVNPDVKGMIYYKSGGWYFELDNTGELELYLYDTTNIGYHKMSISVPLTVWSFVAFTYNGTNETIYLNNVYEMWANTGNIIALTTPAYIGGQDGNSRNYTGMIDELREYRCWYSHEEIEQMRLSNLYKFNSTQWYFSSNQTNLSEGEYNYQIFANNVESDYRIVTYSADEIEKFVAVAATFIVIVFAAAASRFRRVRGFVNRRIWRK